MDDNKTTENWVYAGRVKQDKSTVVDRFLLLDPETNEVIKDENGDVTEYYFKHKRAIYILSGMYRMTVEHKPDGGITRHGMGQFIDIIPDDARRADFRASDAAYDAQRASDKMAIKAQVEWFESWDQLVGAYSRLPYIDQMYFEQSILGRLRKDARAVKRSKK